MTLAATMENATAILADVFGFSEFRGGQRQAVSALLDGRDVAVLLPTGAGKSLCYQVPGITLARNGRGPTLVVSPLIALMHDQVRALTAQGVSAAALNSHQSETEARQTLKSYQAGELELLYVSPERAAQPAFRRLLSKRRVGMFAIDEAHCVSQWGHDFRPEYMQLAELRELSSAPMIAVTATATERVLKEISTHLHLIDPVLVRGDFRRPNLAFSVEHISAHAARLERLVQHLDEAGMRGRSTGKAIVYCSTRSHTEKVAKALASQGFAARHYHAGRTKDARDKAQHAFGTGKLRVLVATNAFGMGIDFPDIRMVLHYQTPGSVEAYYQEAGRAGRDNQSATCVMFFGAADMATQRRISSSGTHDDTAALRAIEKYANADTCRQQMICDHFGHAEDIGACGCCDVCTGSVANVASASVCLSPVSELSDDEVAILIAAVGELSRPAGKTGLARALRGSRAKTLRKCGLLKLSQHGALKAHEERAIVAAIERCLESGQLVRKGVRYPTVWLPNKPVRQSTTETPKAPAATKSTKSTFNRRKYSPLMGALERFRKSKARELKWKLYMVFQKRTMLALDSLRPTTLRELEPIAGLGRSKIDRFGQDILRLVREHH